MSAAAAAALTVLAVLFTATSSAAPPLNEDVLALIVFKSGVTDPTGALSTWNEDDDTPCAWEHVSCDAATTSSVTALSLSSLNLSGHLPGRGLERLRSLRTLSVSGNNLSGELPGGLSSSLRSLDLSGNAFSGEIPDELFASGASLRYLDLSGNRLEGEIPAALLQCGLLLHLNLSSNQLSGSPQPVWGLTRLRELDLSRNFFSGEVPDGISRLHMLKRVLLAGNRFSGDIPAGVGLCPHLTELDLGGNEFSGELPRWVGSLTALRRLDLSFNRIAGGVPAELGGLKELAFLSLAGNLLRGSIPASLSECSSLSELRLNGNSLDGGIPETLLNLPLEVLDLSSNDLAGVIPSGDGRLSETLSWLDLSGNKLTGEIPPEMASYYNLRYLNLSSNSMTARLPQKLIGELGNLSVLDLRGAKLFGTIPSDICAGSGSQLAVVQLDGNALSGEIPEEIGNCSSLYLLSLSHNSLNHSIPAAMARLKKLKILNLDSNELSGEIPPELGGMEGLLAVNLSHNHLVGRLPAAGIFPSLERSAVEGNLGLCTPLVAEPCVMADVPKPLVLDPNAYIAGAGSRIRPAPARVGSPRRQQQHRLLSVSAMIAISAALVIFLGVLVITLLNVSARRRLAFLEHVLESLSSSSTKSGGGAAAAGEGLVGKMVLFTPRKGLKTQDVVGDANSLISKAIEVGRGTYGTVYRATVGDGSTVIAAKKLSGGAAVVFHDDFERELRALGKARHPNLMPLKGFYWAPDLQLLITDFAAGGSLESRLHGRTAPPLAWSERFDIAVGVARGLAHLHGAFRPPIVHYGVKPSNILIDGEGTPRVSDFGLPRLLRHFDKHLAGGYAAPEMGCGSLMKVSEKCDVYGFGVVALELVTGRKAVEYGDDEVMVLVEHVRAAVEAGGAAECLDAAMEGEEFVEEEALPVMKLGLVCTSQVPSSRPSMAEVVQILQVIKAPAPAPETMMRGSAF